MNREQFESLKVGDVFYVGQDPYKHVIREVEAFTDPADQKLKNHSVTTIEGNRVKVIDPLVAFMWMDKEGESDEPTDQTVSS